MGKDYKIKIRIQEVQLEQEETQKGLNHGDADRNQVLHVHPCLAEVGEAGNAILGEGGVTSL